MLGAEYSANKHNYIVYKEEKSTFSKICCFGSTSTAFEAIASTRDSDILAISSSLNLHVKVK